MVLEEYEHAKARGAKIYAELVGFGMSADAYPHDRARTSTAPRRAMVDALQQRRRQRRTRSTTSTRTAPRRRWATWPRPTRSSARFGEHAKKLVVNSTKSMTGHLLGGAGGIESVFTVLAVHDQESPPTINIFNQDPECDLDYCANTARDMKIDVALKNTFGFGGTNGTLVFKRL